jgi:DNA-binding PadR family transcriptional regulator
MVSTKGRKTASSFVTELRRGAIVLCVLSDLQQERYGYSLKQQLAQSGLVVHEGTLYPLLRRLEAQGLLESRWQAGEGQPRRYYCTSARGRELLRELTGEWTALVAAVDRLVVDEDSLIDGTA